MSDKFLLTIDGKQRVISNTPANVERLKQLAPGEYEIHDYDGDQPVGSYLNAAPSSAADKGTYVDEMNVLGSNDAPLPATPPKPVSKPAAADSGMMDKVIKYTPGQVGDGLRSLAMMYNILPDKRKADVQDFGRGVRHGASFGFDDEIAGLASKLAGGDYGKTKQEWQATNEASKQRSPYLYGTGDVVGAAAPVLATGGAASLPELAARLGMRAAPAAIVGGAAEGTVRGAGDAQDGNTLRDAGIGGLVGAVLPAVGVGVRTAAGAVSPTIAQLAKSLRGNVVPANKTEMRVLRDRFGGPVDDTSMGELLEKYVPPSDKARSADDYLVEIRKGLDQGQQKIAALDDKVSAAGANEFIPEAWKSLTADQAKAAADRLSSDVGAGALREASSLRGMVNKLAKFNAPEEGAAGPVQMVIDESRAPKSFSDLRDKIGQYGADAFDNVSNRAETAEQTAAKSMWQRGKDAQKEVLEQLKDPDLSAEFERTNKEFADRKILEKILDNVARGEGSSHAGAELVASGLGGAAQGLVTGTLAGNPIAGAVAGAQLATGSGTRGVIGRAFKSSKAMDSYANTAGDISSLAARLGSGAPGARTAAVSRTVEAMNTSAPQPFTSAGRAMQALKADPNALGSYGSRLAPLMNDADAFARAVEQLEQSDDNFRTLVSGSK